MNHTLKLESVTRSPGSWAGYRVTLHTEWNDDSHGGQFMEVRFFPVESSTPSTDALNRRLTQARLFVSRLAQQIGAAIVDTVDPPDEDHV